jgi:exonuclease VII small subunit
MSKSTSQSLTLEEKLKRLKEIQTMLENKTVNLSESMKLLEEAFELKGGVEKELGAMENRLIDLSKSES